MNAGGRTGLMIRQGEVDYPRSNRTHTESALEARFFNLADFYSVESTSDPILLIHSKARPSGEKSEFAGNTLDRASSLYGYLIASLRNMSFLLSNFSFSPKSCLPLKPISTPSLLVS